MSERCRSDDGSFLGAGKSLSSAYNGFGILFENLPATGENGGSPLLNDGGVNGDEVRCELLSTSGVTINEFNEDGSFSSEGIGSFTYRSYINNVSVGDFTVTINSQSATSTVSFGVPLFSVAVQQESEASADGATVSFSVPLFGVGVSQESTVPEYNSSVSFGIPFFSVAILSGEFDYHVSPGATVDITNLSRRVDIPSLLRRIGI